MLQLKLSVKMLYCKADFYLSHSLYLLYIISEFCTFVFSGRLALLGKRGVKKWADVVGYALHWILGSQILVEIVLQAESKQIQTREIRFLLDKLCN